MKILVSLGKDFGETKLCTKPFQQSLAISASDIETLHKQYYGNPMFWTHRKAFLLNPSFPPPFFFSFFLPGSISCHVFLSSYPQFVRALSTNLCYALACSASLPYILFADVPRSQTLFSFLRTRYQFVGITCLFDLCWHSVFDLYIVQPLGEDIRMTRGKKRQTDAMERGEAGSDHREPEEVSGAGGERGSFERRKKSHRGFAYFRNLSLSGDHLQGRFGLFSGTADLFTFRGGGLKPGVSFSRGRGGGRN